MTKDFIPAPDPIRLIRNVRFYDTPSARDEHEEVRDPPYIPSEREWSELQKQLQRLRIGVLLGISYGAISIITLIVITHK
jgi:hypothetical protein